jgi:DNA-binding protein YbaB
MKRHCRLLLVAFLLGLPVAGFAQASAVPTRISYQGKVTDAAGVPIGNSAPVNRVITFRIWDSPSAVATTNRLYSEQQTVTISGGEFSVLLGAGTSVSGETNAGTLDAVFNGETRFLGITIDDPAVNPDPEISPRQQIVANAFSFRAKVAESVTSQAVTTAMLANNAVNTAQVADSAVTLGKLAANSVDSTKIADNAVNTAEIAAGAVTAAKLGSDVAVWSVNGTTAFRPTGAVGIGTNSPAGPLDVYDANNPRIGFHTPSSTVNATRGLFVGLNNNGPAYVFNWENSHLDFGTNGLNRMRIESDGRLGFGVLNGDTNLNFYFKGNSKPILMKVQGATQEVLTVRGDTGFVGIGATEANPASALSIHTPTNTRVSLHTNKAGSGYGDGAAFGYEDAGSYPTGYVWVYENAALDFATNNLRRMRIEPDGRTGFGIDNGDGFISHAFKQVTKDVNNNGIALGVYKFDGSELATFTTFGCFKPGGGSWAATSDLRLKKDVRALSGSLEKLLQLRSVNFLYKDQEKYAKGEQTGFIAQEMEKVFPQWVSEGPDGMKAISFSGFESHTVQALRELRAEKDAGFAERDAKIAALEQQLRDLQSTSAKATDRLAALERRLDNLATRGLAANSPRE